MLGLLAKFQSFGSDDIPFGSRDTFGRESCAMDDHPYTNHEFDDFFARRLAENPECAEAPWHLRLKLIAQQPSIEPDMSAHSDLYYPGFIRTPEARASTERLIRWRDWIATSRLGSHPIWTIYHRRVGMILEWRAAVPPHLRFWRTPEEEAHRAILHSATSEGLSAYARNQ